MRAALLLLPFLLACGATGPIAINEFVASNQAGLIDDAGGTPDWIELFNTSAAEVSLDGWFVSDDVGNPERHPLAGLTVPGDGYLLLFASGDVAIGDDHLGFKLSAGGEEVVLSSADGIVDATAYSVQTPDVAMARIPDGTGDWAEADPTPGATNE